MKKKPSSREFVNAVIAGEIDHVREMHRKGVLIDKADKYGWLPIHRAAANDRDEIIRLLIEWGSPLEATGTEAWTPLHLAAVSRSCDAVKTLLDAGANINACSAFGDTPLHLAIGPTVTDKLLKTVQILISAGAPMDVCDCNGKTPLDKVREINIPELSKIFEG